MSAPTPARAGLCAAVVLLCSSVCAAQDDASTVKFGPVTIQPSLVVHDIGRDNNVFNEAAHPKSDFTMTISPKAEVVFRARRVKATFLQSTDYVYFKQYTSERGTNQANSLKTEFDLGILQPFVSAGIANTKARLNNEVDVRARHTNEDYSAGVGVKLFTRTSATLKVRRTDGTFDEAATFRGESLARAFNGTTRGIDGSVGVELTPLTSFAVVVSKEQQRFDQAAERNSDTFRVMPTFTFSPLGLLNGSAAFGYRRFTPRDPATPPFKGFVTLVTAGITVFDHHRFDTSILRDVSYSYDRAATYFVQNSASVSWSYGFAGRVDTQLGAARNLMQYHKETAFAGGSDTFTSYSAAVGYRLVRRLRVAVNGDFARRRSKVASDRAFDNHRVVGTLTWGG